MSEHRFGRYEIVSKLGRGGMAEVYRARVLEGEGAGTEVALKRLLPELAGDPGYVAQFLAEGKLSLQLEHPAIVRTYEAGELGGVYFLAMELVEGRDLGQILRRCHKREIHLPVDFAVFLVRTLLEALGHAHAAKIVHGDVSPSNLFISRLGEIKLGDFGSARPRVTSSVVETSAVAGKPYYLSPEALEGALTPAADLWASGVVLYELLTGARPFVGTTPEEVFAAVRAGTYLPPRALRPEVAPTLEGVIRRSLAPAPEERFPGAAHFARALEPHWDERVGTPLAIAAVVRGLFG